MKSRITHKKKPSTWWIQTAQGFISMNDLDKELKEHFANIDMAGNENFTRGVVMGILSRLNILQNIEDIPRKYISET